MSDRCYVRVVLKTEDVKKLTDIVGTAPDDVEPYNEHRKDIQVVIYSEGNYGLHAELVELAEQNVPFFGFHGTGGEYGPGEFCGVNGKYHEVLSHQEWGQYLVCVDADGNILDKDLAAVREFIAEQKKVEKILGAVRE